MRLDRNVNSDGREKYGLVNLREEDDGQVIHGKPGTKEEFFVIKLKDKH